ncbi:hypothetical protein Ancab_000007 [Ancistrocladus abbreviatus]
MNPLLSGSVNSAFAHNLQKWSSLEQLSFSCRFSLSIIPSSLCNLRDVIAFSITSSLGLPVFASDSQDSSSAVEFNTNFNLDVSIDDFNVNHQMMMRKKCLMKCLKNEDEMGYLKMNGAKAHRFSILKSLMVVVTIPFAALGLISPASRNVLLISMLFFYMVLAITIGYVFAHMWRSIGNQISLF